MGISGGGVGSEEVLEGEWQAAPEGVEEEPAFDRMSWNSGLVGWCYVRLGGGLCWALAEVWG